MNVEMDKFGHLGNFNRKRKFGEGSKKYCQSIRRIKAQKTLKIVN
jgi:hypothetical protein